MAKPLRVLLVDDSEDDALLLLRELRRGGFDADSRRVDTPEEFEQALGENRWDIVITDHNMPRFSSAAALAAVRERDTDVPVIIVSGSIGEEIAVAAMRSGANDYIMKDNLARLVPAINRELREVENRRAHRQAESMIRHLDSHDALTGLANRKQFDQRLQHLLDMAKGEGSSHGLLYVDLDQFKVVNDTCGHFAGDQLLKALAQVLKEPMRDSDMLARLGGDEFGVLLETCPLDRAERIAEGILRAVKEFRFEWAGKVFVPGASIGLVMVTAESESINELLSAADVACYTAKDLGRNRVHVYRSDDADLARRRGEMEWVTRINNALENDRLVLFSQRIVRVVPDGTPDNYEFLVRMRGEGGEILPGAFIPAAERYNLMPAVDRWVVDAAFRHVAACAAHHGVERIGTAFINLSGASLSDAGFLAYLLDKIGEHRVPAGAVCFEITETAAIANMKTAVDFIRQVRDAGAHFALDDFGMGMSSFGYLKSLPVDYLKIDGEFVRDVATDPVDEAIVEAINRIGHAVGLRTIGEHVESPDTLPLLARIGVDFAQGYGIQRPEQVITPGGARP
jgi:diguanylate cyclase (GGDEF)-like protein